MRNNYKEVYFENYCNKCVHEKKEEHEEPCSDCLWHEELLMIWDIIHHFLKKDTIFVPIVVKQYSELYKE